MHQAGLTGIREDYVTYAGQLNVDELVTAADSAGCRIADTITHAYKIAP